MSHRIEYLTNGGGKIVEYTDDRRFRELKEDEDNGYITICEHTAYDIVSR